MNETLLTPEEAAGRLKVAKITILRWLRDGKLPGVKVGKLWRVKESDLQAFFDGLSK
jgi:excisionase family DNA binding protein